MSRRFPTRFALRLAALGVPALVVLLLLGGCGEQQGPQAGVPAGVITLENQTEHSGILVALAEVDTFVVTDSLGFFSFGEMPGGSYTLSARYPYFESIEEPIRVNGHNGPDAVNHQLQQVLQFWVEPAETTISISEATWEDSGKIEIMIRAAVVNLTDNTLTVGGGLGPRILVAISPVDHSWPYIPNPDNRDEYCYEQYEWLGSNDLIDLFWFTIEPGNTTKYSTFSYLQKICLEPGTYMGFSSPSDERNYPEYFNAGYFWDPNDPQTWIYSLLNRTLLKKHNLFRPVILHVTE